MVGRARWYTLIQVLWLLGVAALAIRFGRLVIVGGFALSYAWSRWIPLPGLDLRTSRLARGYRAQHWKATEVGFPDVVAFLGGALIGLVSFAFLGRNGSDSALSGFLIAGLAIGSIGGAVGRRMLSRRLADRREQKQRLEAALDLRCRCLTLDSLTGPHSRAYVERHLEPEGLGLVRRCPRTGSRFLDWPSVPATVRVHGIVSSAPDYGSGISPICDRPGSALRLRPARRARTRCSCTGVAGRS